MNWRTAKSLLTLRNQIDALYPGRNKASDGTIGDAAHSAEGTGSDHNPNKDGVVCALDITHDPDHGVDIDKLSDQLAATRDPRIKYIIANRLILCPADNGWIWTDFQGDPHTSHLHISVYGDYDNQQEWNIGGDIMDREDAINSYQSTFHRYPSEVEIQGRIGKKYSEVARAEREAAEWRNLDTAMTLYPGMVKAKETLLKEVGNLQALTLSTDAQTKLNKIKEILGS